MKSKLDWLQQCLDSDGAAVDKMIQRLPAILDYSVDNNLEPKLNWPQQCLNMDDAKVSKIVQ